MKKVKIGFLRVLICVAMVLVAMAAGQAWAKQDNKAPRDRVKAKARY